MPVRIVQLGSPRAPGEGLRLGTVRRPPRGVPKAEFAKRDFYDLWMPALSPTEALVKLARSAPNAKTWATVLRKFRAEMNKPEPKALLNLLAALSHQTSLAVGCYCENEAKCHRQVLRALLKERGAEVI